jgi:putative transposase
MAQTPKKDTRRKKGPGKEQKKKKPSEREGNVRLRKRKKKARQLAGNSWTLTPAFINEFLMILASYEELGLLEPHGGGPGRKRADPAAVPAGIFFVLRTGIHWKAIPKEFGSGSTVHKYFQIWAKAGVFQSLWSKGLQAYGDIGIDWQWVGVDGSMAKARLGGEDTGPSPVDGGKLGTKRSVLVDGRGVPLAVVLDGANRHDSKMLGDTLDARVADWPKGCTPNCCLDKGYDGEPSRQAVIDSGMEPHIVSRGDEKRDLKSIPGYKARRWVVERVFSWLNNMRKLLVRYEKKSANYLGLTELACAVAAYRQVGVV